MKFILSRKGFDSESGGHPSPILPNNRMVSLPIPSNDSIFYSELQLGYKQYQTYYDLMKELVPEMRSGGKKIKINETTRCHLDPDLNKDVLKRYEGWMPMFGQIGAAETHLENMDVKEDDIFLFFGTFRKTQSVDQKIVFDQNDPDKHIIFGYMQIGKILKCDLEVNIQKWMNYHPHCDIVRRGKTNNRIYLARKSLTWSKKLPGAGIFNYHKSLVLTKKGCPKSVWCLDPALFKSVDISYHSEKSWKRGCFQSVGRGQEFVIEENRDVERYFKNLIERNLLLHLRKAISLNAK